MQGTSTQVAVQIELEQPKETENVEAQGTSDTALLKPGLFVMGLFDDKYLFHIGEIIQVDDNETFTISFMARLKKSG